MSPTYECCKFRGSVVALDGATGRQIWKSYSVLDPPRQLEKGATGPQLWGPAGGAIWSAPTIDVKKKVVYAATGNSYTNVSIDTSDAILAFDLETGSLLWARQVQPKDNFTMGCGRGANCPADRGPDFDFGVSPILRELPGGKRILICGQKSGILWGLDPDDRGKILWQTRVGQGRRARRNRVGTDGRSGERLCRRLRSLEHRREPSRWTARRETRDGREGLERAAARAALHRGREGLQQRAVGRHFVDPRRSVLGFDRRPFPRLSSRRPARSSGTSTPRVSLKV